MNVLDKIINDKKLEVEERSRITPIERIKDSQRLYSIRDFNGKLKNKGLQIIAEIKRRSPSEGDINIHADPPKIAKSYAKNGAACISILTDRQYFGGQLEFIQLVKAVVDIPILRKDFIISEYQVWETFHSGADAILLIADVIEEQLMKDLYQLASNLGLHVLVEMHQLKYLKMINDLGPKIVGVNCRDLKTMDVDINYFEKIVMDLPKEATWVAESGINNISDLEYVSKLGFHSALVGSFLMKSNDPGMVLSQLQNIS